ncbi:hybrid sensor histidine kinase/response regulator [Herbaspirillum sp. AP02]|uniref:hybrid sensor histidine kinase/response regulator n=2 Tax=unclassified Herbaspirillum TaxID=2624150 RepID=UPI0018CA60C8|nr:hybrid sensor histidine kinase/response regulator [Herbaspirillum sp. AP02]MBG7617941.1 hybrid sensor histidine kinase/response regulator [Herbaspirillum sp. AP02]
MSAIAAHVLVLEDDDGLLALATRVLRKQGHRVTAVADAVAALAAVRDEQPDLLIVDYNLQALDTGLDFFRQLRASGVDIPAIMVSGVSDEPRIIEALRAGVADILPKTSDYLDYLPAAVQRLLNQQALQRLAEAQRMAGVREELVTTLSQELRTPLNAIIGWAQYLLRDASDPEQLQKGLLVIERNARLQAQRVEQLLEFSRIMSGKLHMDMQWVDMASVVGQAIASVQAAADAKQIHLHSVLDSPAPIRGDAARLQQVVWNLLMNAIRFTPRQGRVQATLRQPGAALELEVADNGPGIPPQLLASVFERFRRDPASQAHANLLGDVSAEASAASDGTAPAPEPGAGTGLGLGLAITRQLVELHGGRVHAESPGPGLGARFFVTLPLTAGG